MPDRPPDVARFRELAELMGEEAVRWRLYRGLWQRPHPRVVVTHSGHLSVGEQLEAALRHAGCSAVLAGPTAAYLDGLRGFESAPIHVLVPHGHIVTPTPGLVVRQTRTLNRDDVHPSRDPRRTRLARSLLDMASQARSDEQAAAILAAGVQQRLVTAGQLTSMLCRLPRLPRRAAIRQALADISMGAQALTEITFVRFVRSYGLPAPDLQVPRRDDRGRMRWRDAHWRKWRLTAEIDGFGHLEIQQWLDDLDRQNELVIGDELVLRFGLPQLRYRKARAAAQLEAALRHQGWPGN